MQSCAALGTSLPNTTSNPTSFKFACGTNSCDYRARYYNPTLQRFLSEDPAGLAGGINSYSYTGNNPTNFRDPTGLDYNVNYDPSTDTINVTASVLVYGPSGSDQLAKAWQQDTNRYWNAGNPRYGHCKVKFSFSFTFAPNVNDNGWNLPSGADNYIHVEPTPLFGNSLGATYSDHGYWWQGITDQDVAHEMGHLLGLGDDYGRIIPDWLFNWLYGNHSGHMMSNSLIRDVAQHEIDDVLAGRACGCKK
jgi:RHS repeat-associated protein